MRKLTFEGFLKQYVAELSGVQTASVHKLADCLSENPRLKEPLFLYALAFDKVDLLLRYTVTGAIVAEYEQLSNRYSLAQMLLLLEKQSPELPEGYLKVWRSYCSVRDAVLADNDTKELIHRRVLELQKKKKLTNYRLYTDAFDVRFPRPRRVFAQSTVYVNEKNLKVKGKDAFVVWGKLGTWRCGFFFGEISAYCLLGTG